MGKAFVTLNGSSDLFFDTWALYSGFWFCCHSCSHFACCSIRTQTKPEHCLHFLEHFLALAQRRGLQRPRCIFEEAVLQLRFHVFHVNGLGSCRSLVYYSFLSL